MSAVIGKSANRVDGPLKVTGGAHYASDHRLPHTVHAVLLGATIARGKIEAIDTAAAEALPGVLRVYTYKNRPKMGTPPNSLFQGGLLGESTLPLSGHEIRYFGQCVAMVVAETPEQAHYAAECVGVVYRADEAATVIEQAEETRYKPVHSNGEPLQIKRGDFETAYAGAEVRLDATYETPSEHPNPMEPHACVAHWQGGEALIYEATQWAIGARTIAAATLEVDPSKVRILAPFIGGMFGSKVAGLPHLMLSCLASRDLGRPVKAVLGRDQLMRTVGYRSRTIQRFELGATAAGKLVALRHHTTSQTSITDEFPEPCGMTSRLLYDVPNYENVHEMVRLNTFATAWMRAPGEATCQFAQEVALDELAEKVGVDPLELRRLNHADKNPHSDRPWSSKCLLECYERGAELFGWSKRNPKPRSMKEGRLLVGYGMATATYPAMTFGATVRVKLWKEGSRARASVATSGIDVGTGMYTMMALAVSEELGLPMADVTALLGDTHLPACALAGGSNLTSSVAPAIAQACAALRRRLCKLANLEESEVAFAGAALRHDGGKVPILELVHESMEETGETAMMMGRPSDYAFQSFGAQFAEVHVDPAVRTVRVARMTGVFDCGRILNAKAARSQILGGMTFGIGMALLEEMRFDPRAGRQMNSNLSGYLVPVNADVPELQVEYVGQPDFNFNSLGCRGVGEIGNTGASAAIANAVYHATGVRVRKLPITVEDLL